MEKEIPKCPKCGQDFEIEGCTSIFSDFFWKRYDFPRCVCPKCNTIFYGNEKDIRKRILEDIKKIYTPKKFSRKEKNVMIKSITRILYKTKKDYRGLTIIKNL